MFIFAAIRKLAAQVKFGNYEKGGFIPPFFMGIIEVEMKLQISISNHFNRLKTHTNDIDVQIRNLHFQNMNL